MEAENKQARRDVFQVGVGRSICYVAIIMLTPTETFLNEEALTLSILGALGHAEIYLRSATREERQRVREDLRQRLRHLRSRYAAAVPEESHFQQILQLSNDMSAAHGQCLRAGRFRIGPTQKALNLYLKHLWAHGWIPTPPHCPLDALTLSRLPSCRTVAWTQMDGLDEYRRCIAAAKNAAHGRCLAEWEIRIWHEARVPRLTPQKGVGVPQHVATP